MLKKGNIKALITVFSALTMLFGLRTSCVCSVWASSPDAALGTHSSCLEAESKSQNSSNEHDCCKDQMPASAQKSIATNIESKHNDCACEHQTLSIASQKTHAIASTDATEKEGSPPLVSVLTSVQSIAETLPELNKHLLKAADLQNQLLKPSKLYLLKCSLLN